MQVTMTLATKETMLRIEDEIHLREAHLVLNPVLLALVLGHGRVQTHALDRIPGTGTDPGHLVQEVTRDREVTDTTITTASGVLGPGKTPRVTK